MNQDAEFPVPEAVKRVREAFLGKQAEAFFAFLKARRK